MRVTHRALTRRRTSQTRGKAVPSGPGALPGSRPAPLRGSPRLEALPASSCPPPPPYQRLQAVGELQQGSGDPAEAFLHGDREALPHASAGQRAVRRAGGQRHAGPLGARLSHGGRRHGAAGPLRRAASYSGGHLGRTLPRRPATPALPRRGRRERPPPFRACPRAGANAPPRCPSRQPRSLFPEVAVAGPARSPPGGVAARRCSWQCPAAGGFCRWSASAPREWLRQTGLRYPSPRP